MHLAAGVVLWQRDLSNSDIITSLSVDPLDRRRLCLCGSQGALVVLTMGGQDGEALAQKQYRVNVQQEKKQQQEGTAAGKAGSSSLSSSKTGKDAAGSGASTAHELRAAPATLQVSALHVYYVIFVHCMLATHVLSSLHIHASC